MSEEQIIDLLKKENEDFRRLYQEHRDLDNMLSDLNKKHYLSPDEEVEINRMKKEKLYKKDKIAEMLREYKKQAAAS